MQQLKWFEHYKRIKSFSEKVVFRSFLWFLLFLEMLLIIVGPHRLNIQFSGDSDDFTRSIVLHLILNLILFQILQMKNAPQHQIKFFKKIEYKLSIDTLPLVFLFAFLIYMSASYLWSDFLGSLLNPYFYLIQILCSGILLREISRAAVIKTFSGLFIVISFIVYVSLATKMFGIQVFPGDQLNSLPDRYLVYSSGPNVWPRWILFALILILWKLLFNEIGHKYGAVLMLLFPSLLWLLALSGSRAVYFAFTVSFIVILIIAKRFGYTRPVTIYKNRFNFFIGIILAFSLEVAQSFPATNMLVFRVFDLTVVDKSSSGRGEFLSSGLEIFSENKIIGVGEGSYSKISGMDYPHNIFIEILAEGGIIAGVLLALAFWSQIRLYLHSRHSSKGNFTLNTIVFTIIVAILLLQQFSGSIVDARFLFLLAPLLRKGETVALAHTPKTN